MTRSRLLTFTALVAFASATSVLAAAQNKNKAADLTTEHGPKPTRSTQAMPPNVYRPEGTTITPASAKAAPGHFHTNYQIFVPKGQPALASQQATFQFAETPASLGCVYGVGPKYAGCNPATGRTNHPTGGWGAIVLVDAYDNPNAASDLAFFSHSHGLPVASFRKVYANKAWGTFTWGEGEGALTASCLHAPPGDEDWGLEEDLDIQYAHAMAPSAQIVLVEACSNSTADLLYAEVVANVVAQEYGGGDISNSWGGAEDPGQLGDPSGLPDTGWDSAFWTAYICNEADQCTFPTNITYFASAGDSGWGAGWPSSNPWVVSAGGTSIYRDRTGNYLNEGCWNYSGGGPSAIEYWQDADIYQGPGPWANAQYGLFGGFGAPRDTPDIAFDADPYSGVYVYDTYAEGGGGWYIVGGTSVSSPALAGIVNSANNRLGNAALSYPGYYTTEENNYLYSQIDGYLTYPTNFYDVTMGAQFNGIGAYPGYDECTGLGSLRGKLGK